MIQTFVNRFIENKDLIRAIFRERHPEDYLEILKNVVSIISDSRDAPRPDPERIHVIDDSDYQGTLVFIIGETGYQPSAYWYVRVIYGSCSSCDILERIRYSDPSLNDKPTKTQVDDYMTLALHIVQNLKRMEDTEWADSESSW